MKEIERRLIRKELDSCEDNRSKAARRLKVRRTPLLGRMDRLGLRKLGAFKDSSPASSKAVL